MVLLLMVLCEKPAPVSSILCFLQENMAPTIGSHPYGHRRFSVSSHTYGHLWFSSTSEITKCGGKVGLLEASKFLCRQIFLNEDEEPCQCEVFEDGYQKIGHCAHGLKL